MDKIKILTAKDVELSENSVYDNLGKQLSFDIPEGCDLIVLAGNIGGGWLPYRCLLPHQVYVEDLRKAFEEKRFEVIAVMPLVSKNVFSIAYKNEYGRKRWNNCEKENKKPSNT